MLDDRTDCVDVLACWHTTMVMGKCNMKMTLRHQKRRTMAKIDQTGSFFWTKVTFSMYYGIFCSFEFVAGVVVFGRFEWMVMFGWYMLEWSLLEWVDEGVRR